MPGSEPPPGPESDATEGRRLFDGDAWIGGTFRRLRASAYGAALKIDCTGARGFFVGPGGAWVRADPLDAGPLDAVEIEVLLGPVVLAVLACRGTFALHASAVRTPSGVAAFLGDTGAGKSTLAAGGGPGWRRVADDVLPVRERQGGATVLPRFPQLKLGPAQQYPADAPAGLELKAVYLLSRAADSEPLSLEPLGESETALALIANTVSARLFAPETLEAHFAFAARVASTVPRAARLHVPWRLEAVPDARAVVLADLKAAMPGARRGGGAGA